jgi:hypothetical protein
VVEIMDELPAPAAPPASHGAPCRAAAAAKPKYVEAGSSSGENEEGSGSSSSEGEDNFVPSD